MNKTEKEQEELACLATDFIKKKHVDSTIALSLLLVLALSQRPKLWRTSVCTPHRAPALQKLPKLLVFIHGFEGSSETFGNFPVDLAQSTNNGYLVYPTYTSRGNGSKIVDDFVKWIDSKDDPKKYSSIVLLGHSMGGIIAVAAFQKLKSKNDKKTLVDQIIFFDSPFHGIADTIFTETLESPLIVFAIKMMKEFLNVALPAAAVFAICRLISSSDPNMDMEDTIKKIETTCNTMNESLKEMKEFLSFALDKTRLDNVKFYGFFIKRVVLQIYPLILPFDRINITFVI